MKITGLPQEQQPVITLGDHETWMKAVTYQKICPNHAGGKESDTFTSYSNPGDISQLVEAMVFREKSDTVYDPAITASRRRVEYPTINAAIVNSFRKWGPDHPLPYGPVVKQDVQLLVEEGASKCDTSTPLGDDRAIFEELIFQKAYVPDSGSLLKTLYWRGRVQMAVFDVFSTLCSRGLVDSNCLRPPMMFYKVTEPVSSLAWLLSCYERPQKESQLDPKPFKFHGDAFESPLIWLATMILRGCRDIKNTIETTTTCLFLGDLDEQASQEWIQHGAVKHFQIDMNVMADESVGKSEFGFWLPHGIGMVDDDVFTDRLRSRVNIFNRIEKTFRDFFQLPPEVIYLESEQSSFFERAPAKMPGWKRSGDWTIAFDLGGSTATANSASAGGSGSTPPTSVSSTGKQSGFAPK